MSSGENKKELKIGSDCFWKGNRYRIMSGEGNFWMLHDGSWWAQMVPKHEVEPLVGEVFEIGQAVQSDHVFRGHVVAFDNARNEAICISVREVAGSRKRYSYKVHEIHSLDELTFHTNKKYKIRHCGQQLWVRALDHPNIPTRVVLYDVDSGAIVRIPQRQIDLRKLESEYGIIVDSDSCG